MKEIRSDLGDEVVCNCLAVRQAARHITQIYDRHLAGSGLTATQYSILTKLARLGPMSISELASQMSMDRTTMTRGLRPLERDGLVKVGSGPDGRTRRIQLTRSGVARQQIALKSWRDAQDEFERHFGQNSAVDLRAMMYRVVSLRPDE